MLMIKVIARIEFGWWRGTSWIPVMQIAGTTHRERASERLEAKTSLRSKIAVGLALTWYFLWSSFICSCSYRSLLSITCLHLMIIMSSRRCCLLHPQVTSRTTASTNLHHSFSNLSTSLEEPYSSFSIGDRKHTLVLIE